MPFFAYNNVHARLLEERVNSLTIGFIKMSSRNKFNLIIKYTIFGCAFGLLFPFAATCCQLVILKLPVNAQSILEIHLNPLLWIIDTAPVFLGLFAYSAGVRQQQLVDQADKLEDLVSQRSTEIIRQKLFYEALVDNSPIAIVTLDQDQKIISINPAFQELFGYHQDEVMGKELDTLIANPNSPHEAFLISQKVWEGEAVHEFGKRKHKDGHMVDVEIFGEQIRINGKRVGIVGLYRDITVERRAQEALSASEERFRRMFSDSPVALRMEDYSPLRKWLDENYRDQSISLKAMGEKDALLFQRLAALPQVIDLNEATLWLFGVKDKDEMQKNLHNILSQECRNEALDILDCMLAGETSLERELIYNRMDGKKIYTITKLSVIPGHEKTWGRVLFSNLDITERKLAEERLTYISLHDIMTGIYNRAFFEEEVSRLSKSRSFPISILVMDMDNLKTINDQYGHQAGDLALQSIANIVKNCFRSDDVIARIGGDEIAVLLTGVDAEGAENAKARINHAVQNHNQTRGTDIPLSVSIGCATAHAGDNLSEKFQKADTLMYEEKKTKKKNSPAK